MLKIVYLIDTLKTGGAEKSLVDIAIMNKEVQSVFVTIYGGNDFVNILEQNDIDYIDLGIHKKYAFKEAAQKFRLLLDEIKPDVIHSTLFRADLVARIAKKYNNVPLISSFVNNSYIVDRYRKLNFINKLKLAVFQKIDAYTAKKVDFFISNSQTIKYSNAKALGINCKKIQVIFRGRDLSKFSNLSSELLFQTKQQLKLNEGQVTLLNVSRLLDRKGQLDLLKALKDLIVLCPNIKLLIAGEGAYRSVLEEYIHENNLGRNVELLGNRNDIPCLLFLADFFVFPSHYEGLPGALIEAMMAEKVIICSDIPENKECVTNGEAVFFRKGDIAHLVKKIGLVLGNPEQYKGHGIKAREQAVEKFSIAKIVEQYNVVYQFVIQNYSK